MEYYTWCLCEMKRLLLSYLMIVHSQHDHLAVNMRKVPHCVGSSSLRIIEFILTGIIMYTIKMFT